MKNIFQKLKSPSVLVLVLTYVLTLLFAALSIFIVTNPSLSATVGAFAYPIFALSAIFFAYAVYTVFYLVPIIKAKAVTKLEKRTFTNKLISSYNFRTVVFSAFPFVLNIAYVLFNAIMSFIALSIWHAALAGYYLVLVVMRGGILLHHRKLSVMRSEVVRKKKELKTYALTGALLLILALALSVAVGELVLGNDTFEYSGLTIYVAAAYAFYKIIMAIINVVRARRQDDMTIKASRNINMSDAMVSILALQTAMFKAFSPEMNVSAANALTGSVVLLATAVIGISMMINATRKYSKIKIEERELSEEKE